MDEKILNRFVELVLVVVPSGSLLMHGRHQEIRLRIFRVVGYHLLAAFGSQLEVAEHVLLEGLFV